MKAPLQVWLADIRGEIRAIREATKDINLERFSASWTLTRSVQHGLLIIAEAAKHIPSASKARCPEVPWQEIHGLGNLLRHEYRRIDPAILWSIVVQHLDQLDAAIALLQQDGDDQTG